MNTGRIEGLITQYERVLQDPSKPWDAPLGWAESVTGVRRFKLFLAVLGVVSFYLMLGYGATATGHFICYAYAAYGTVTLTVQGSSVAGTTSPRKLRADGAKWYTYWMLFATILLVENHLPVILHAVPYYTLVKTVFLVWCAMPIENNGTVYVRANVFQRYLTGGEPPARSRVYESRASAAERTTVSPPK